MLSPRALYRIMPRQSLLCTTDKMCVGVDVAVLTCWSSSDTLKGRPLGTSARTRSVPLLVRNLVLCLGVCAFELLWFNALREL